MIAKLPYYWKFVVAVLGGVLVIGPQVINAVQSGSSDGWSSGDTYTLVIVVVTAVGVYWKANKPANEPVSE